jgi:hypothetical protein
LKSFRKMGLLSLMPSGDEAGREEPALIRGELFEERSSLEERIASFLDYPVMSLNETGQRPVQSSPPSKTPPRSVA